jgi:hypothetical protein
MKKLTIGLLLAPTCLGLACAEMSNIDLSSITGQTNAPLTEDTVAAGLKEALRVGTQRSASTLSAAGGFSDNALLRIGLPDEYQRVASALRSVGLGGRVDELELSMNRAAEQAAGEATPVFASAISSMSLGDAFEILNGAPDAATSYFEARTTDELRSRFTPVVTDAMSQVGVYQALQDVTAAYDALPFSKPPATDISEWVTDGALAGLFSTLAEEEQKIRDDPGARSSALLRQVFGQAGS